MLYSKWIETKIKNTRCVPKAWWIVNCHTQPYLDLHPRWKSGTRATKWYYILKKPSSQPATRPNGLFSKFSMFKEIRIRLSICYLLCGTPTPSAESQHPKAWQASIYGHLRKGYLRKKVLEIGYLSIRSYWPAPCGSIRNNCPAHYYPLNCMCKEQHFLKFWK